jgi:putative ubiquitin-RnfH superfamily antitoxin RatB of RatAB toxin-antitoxin module
MKGISMKNIKVRIKLNETLAASAGCREKTIELPEGSSARDAINSSGLSERMAGVCCAAINGLVIDDSSVLKDSDCLMLYLKLVVRGG